MVVCNLTASTVSTEILVKIT